MMEGRAAGEASELLPCLQATGVGLSASVPRGGSAQQRGSCHLVPFGQGEVTLSVCGDGDHPRGFQGWVAMPRSGSWARVLLTLLVWTSGSYFCHNFFTMRTIKQ